MNDDLKEALSEEGGPDVVQPNRELEVCHCPACRRPNNKKMRTTSMNSSALSEKDVVLIAAAVVDGYRSSGCSYQSIVIVKY
jgi:hypothetical protein